MKTLEPKEFEQECTTVWSFARRGRRATHNSKYRGNRSPDVVRNLILRYSKPGDTLFEPMVGGGTTAIECKLLNRNLYAYDINPESVQLTKELLDFESKYSPRISVEVADATERHECIEDESIDFALTHPPYVNIIQYSESIDRDLSLIKDVDAFCDKIELVAKECRRVLKPGKFCAILMGDTRRNKMYIPLAYNVLERFFAVGFELKEDIVKVQHNCKATGFWVNKSKEHNFLLIMHEHLFIFQKPVE